MIALAPAARHALAVASLAKDDPFPVIAPQRGLHAARILIIDDEEPNVRLLEGILKRAGYKNFLSTTDSRKVAALFQDFQPDLVLTDWLMPHLDGSGVIAEISKLVGGDDYLPIIVLTADATQQTKQRALAAGAADFLTKPFDPLEVLLRMRNVLQARSSHLEIQEQKTALEESVCLRTVELERALTELKGAQNQVIQQERLAALGAMAGGIAHDFNNSLCAIMGYSELLLRGVERGLTKEAATGPLTTILTAAEDASKIVQRLREFYRPNESEEQRAPVDLNKLVEQAISLSSPKWKTQSIAGGREIFVETDLHDIPLITGNAAELREVLTNLIFNAVDAMPDGGPIFFRTRVADHAVLLQITDPGVGMSDEVRTHCLEPFFTTKGEGGTGLGLAMVFGIIQRHSGTIDIESAPGRGTTFSFRFPISPSQDATLLSQAEGLYQRPRHVLVVDDQPVLCQLVCEYLENDLHTTETAADGVEALAKFRAGNFDLVITDQVMTPMNGYDLAAALKKMRPEVPVILLTGYVSGAVSEPTKTKNIDIVIGKPLSLAALRAAVGRVISA